MMFLVAVALLLASVSGVVWKVTAERAIGAVSLVWASYAVYGAVMATGVLCSGDCDIRVDLVGILPLLVGVTAGTISKVEAKRRLPVKAGAKAVG